MKSTLIVLSVLVVCAAGTQQLTSKDWDDEVSGSGKGVFVKFYAPWCGHCKKLAPTWDKLSAEYADSKTVLVADVDCTVEKDLCGQFGVRGYPTLKYFTGTTGSDGESYEGGRDFDALKTFVSENLGPSCGPATKELCDEEQLAAIAEVEALSTEDIQSTIDERTKALADAEETFKTEVDKLQATYKALMEDKDAATAAVQKATPSTGTLRGVLKARKDAAPAAEGHDEL